MKMKKIICLILYYSIARYMPSSSISSFSKRVRYILCRNIFLKCGKNVNIERGAFFGKGDRIEIGNNSGIGKYCVVHNNIVIGDNVMMGPKCFFLESKHAFDRLDIPMISQGVVDKKVKVVIKDNVWIGREVMVIGDRIIEEGTIVGARAVLTKNFPRYSIVGGNPSKLIRSRLPTAYKNKENAEEIE